MASVSGQSPSPCVRLATRRVPTAGEPSSAKLFSDEIGLVLSLGYPPVIDSAVISRIMTRSSRLNDRVISMRTRQFGFAANAALRRRQEAGGRVGRRKARTRQALIDAARALLAARSIESLSVDEITGRADVAKGTFYNYFDDKDDLARATAAAVRAELEAEIGRVNARIADPAVRIARAFVRVLWFGILRPEHAAAMMRLFPRAADPSAPLNKGVSADIRAGLGAGRIAVPSVDAGVAYVVGVAAVGLNRAIGFSHAEGAVFARSLGTILLRGLGLSRNEASRIMNSAVASIMESSNADGSRWE